MIPSPPETRASLILRLRDAADVAAWDEFVAIYGPLVYRLTLARGLQPADADDVVQQVFTAVAQSVGRWVEQTQRGRFRGWLLGIARNVALKTLTRRPHGSVGLGGEQSPELMDDIEAPGGPLSSQFDLEYRREVYRWAAQQVRRAIEPGTWNAFHLTHVEGVSIANAADQLNLSVGNVYIARSRVMNRLRELTKQFEVTSSPLNLVQNNFGTTLPNFPRSSSMCSTIQFLSTRLILALLAVGFAQSLTAQDATQVAQAEPAVSEQSTQAASDNPGSRVIIIETTPEAKRSEVIRQVVEAARGSVDEVRDHQKSLDLKTRELAAQLREPHPDPATGDKLRSQLRQAVQQAFDARQKLQRAELAEFARRLQNIQQSIEMREKISEQIIDRRVAELLDPNLKWDVVESSDDELSRAVESHQPEREKIHNRSSHSMQPQKTGLVPSGSEIVFKTNIRNLRRSPDSDSTFESLIQVDLSGPPEIAWLFGEDPLRREPLGFPFCVDNVSGGGNFDFIDENGRSIRSLVRMKCADASDGFWRRINDLKVGIHVTHEDFRQVLSGKSVTKVVFLPDDQPDDAPASLETLVSSKMPPGIDVLAEADRKGQPIVLFSLTPRSPSTHFETPGDLMAYAVDCQKRGDRAGWLACWADEATKPIAASYLITSTIILHQFEINSTESRLPGVAKQAEQLTRLIDEELGNAEAKASLAALVQATKELVDDADSDLESVAKTIANSPIGSNACRGHRQASPRPKTLRFTLCRIGRHKCGSNANASARRL